MTDIQKLNFSVAVAQSAFTCCLPVIMPQISIF
jgi:hypothetical protein